MNFGQKRKEKFEILSSFIFIRTVKNVKETVSKCCRHMK